MPALCTSSPQVAGQSIGWPSNSLLVGRNGHHVQLNRDCFTSPHPCRLWWRLPTSRIERAWNGGSWPAASLAAGPKSEPGRGCWQRSCFAAMLLCCGWYCCCRWSQKRGCCFLCSQAVAACLAGAGAAQLLPTQPASFLCFCLGACHAGHLPDPALESAPLLPPCRWHTELVSPLLRSDYAAGAAGGVAGGSPVGQPLLEWTGSAPTAQPLERSSSIPMPAPGQPAGSPSGGWLAPAASVPHALEGRLAGAAQAGERSPSPPAAPMRRGIIGSLPTFFGGQGHEPQHLQHLQRHHPRWAASRACKQLFGTCSACKQLVRECGLDERAGEACKRACMGHKCAAAHSTPSHLTGTRPRWRLSSRAWLTVTWCTCRLGSIASEHWLRWHRCRPLPLPPPLLLWVMGGGGSAAAALFSTAAAYSAAAFQPVCVAASSGS